MHLAPQQDNNFKSIHPSLWFDVLGCNYVIWVLQPFPIAEVNWKTSVPPRYEKSWEMEEVEERRKVSSTLNHTTHTLRGLLFHHTQISNQVTERRPIWPLCGDANQAFRSHHFTCCNLLPCFMESIYSNFHFQCSDTIVQRGPSSSHLSGRAETKMWRKSWKAFVRFSSWARQIWIGVFFDKSGWIGRPRGELEENIRYATGLTLA